MSSKPFLSFAAIVATASSLIGPVAGVATAPLLARVLGPAGRGDLAASLAPGTLMVSIATIGLPEALTYVLATRPGATRRALAVSAVMTTVGTAVAFLLIALAGPYLVAGSTRLLSLLLFATLLNIPGLYVNLLRGAATGLQLWRLIAYERIVSPLLRAGLIVGLALVDQLTVLTAILATAIPGITAGFFYIALLRRNRSEERTELDPTIPPSNRSLGRTLLSYGLRVWLGSVSSIILGRSAQLLIVPLAGSEALGIYVVATTVSDLPLIVAAAIQSVLFGVASNVRNAAKATLISRAAFLMTALLCAAIASTSGLFIAPLFGAGFGAAILPLVLLLLSTLICVPGLMSASVVAAWGRPEYRTIALLVTVLVNIGLLFVFVPVLGVYGACLTSILSNAILTSISVVGTARLIGSPAVDFFLPRRGDWRSVQQVAAQYMRRRRTE